MSHIPIDFDRILFTCSYLFPGLITVSSWWKKMSLAPLLPRNVSLLINMYEKFVLVVISSWHVPNTGRNFMAILKNEHTAHTT